ncbi:MAG TPA: glutamate--tRNA ligase family protein, partial [Steroidobacteraceae bacterium]|nr:glutamate--tRNA ligase family protein [Steroidobacteraceae bacterium]
HMSLLLGADGAPLSKRHGAASLHEFRQRGFLPEALRNHLVRLGHTVERDDWLSDEQMLEQFAIERLGRAPARFDEGQLMHWQKLAVAHASAERVAEWLRPAVARWIPSDRLGTFVELVRGNIVLPPDAADWAQRLAAGGPPLDEDARVEIEQAGAAFFVAAGAALTGVGADLKPLVRALSSATGRRGPELYRPLRAALTGTLSGPELAPTLAWLGPAEAARRIETARAAAS